MWFKKESFVIQSAGIKPPPARMKGGGLFESRGWTNPYTQTNQQNVWRRSDTWVGWNVANNGRELGGWECPAAY